MILECRFQSLENLSENVACKLSKHESYLKSDSEEKAQNLKFDCHIFLCLREIIFISKCEQKINFNLFPKEFTNKSDI